MVKKAEKVGKVKVALGLSGGVDSAVSAYLLKKSGYDVYCVYLNCYDGDTPGCRGDNDRKDALAIAMRLGLPFQVLDFRKEYQAAVIDYFKKEYLLGRTPNPDVVCNRDIKFGLFLDWAIKEGFDYIATGHYADGPDFSERKIVGTPASAEKRATSRERIVREVGEWQAKAGATFLRIPKDLHKDQTYFLWAVPKEKFKRVLFPLGNLLKTEVREIALKIGLPVAQKKDSTGICFVGEVRVEDFLKKLGVKEKAGEVVIRVSLSFPRKRESIYIDSGSKPGMTKESAGTTKYRYQVIGHHRGVWFYTIGQRHGFEVNRLTGQQAEKVEKADQPPLYVIEKDIKKNLLVVGFGADCYRDSFEVAEWNWLTDRVREIREIGEIRARIRHGGELIPCCVEMIGGHSLKIACPTSHGRSPGGRENCKLKIKLSAAQRGVAPGQSAVFYDKNGVVLGGGVIQ